MTKKALQVLNASAGSGKTYHLVREYLRLLMQDGAETHEFSHILAMTFTNKAALEMKERILHALDAISDPNSSHPLTKELAKELSLPEIEIEARSRKILHAILHRYEDFHVMTIDKFNLRLIKSFGRDLDLPHDFEVTLDEGELIERVTDMLLSQLGTAESKRLNQLMIAYAKSNIDEGQQWNFRRNLVDFGKILTSERNHPLVERLLQMDFSPENYGALRKQIKAMDDAFADMAKQLADQISAEGLDPERLPRKGQTYNKIVQISQLDQFPEQFPLLTDAFLNLMDAELKPGQHFPESIKLQLRRMYAHCEAEQERHATLQLYRKNFFNMALLQYLADALNQVRNNEQLIRISEFNTLISKLIQEENTPFIYERLGTRFKHFLLDEFQDTSRLQWLNMVPLIHESISQQQENLIVGDPKQSIYRFKNGVAEQFVALPGIYNPENHPRIASHSRYFEQMGTVEALENNWRSAPAIVQFNNQFFEDMRTLVPENVALFYNSIEQNPQSTKKGRIFISSREGKVSSDDLLPRIIEWIEESRRAGHRGGDICILGNRNTECNRWAVGLTDAGYQVVSSESLLIRNHLKVQLTIAYLRRRTRPGSEQEIRRFAELYFRVSKLSYSNYQSYFSEIPTSTERSKKRFDESAFLRDHFGGEDAFYFKHESIYDLIQGFYKMLRFNELNDPYLHHLADFAFEFGLHRGPDLVLFLKEYEARKNKLAVQIPEGPDAVRIMTIHKSKGLEFPVVIVPSMDFPAQIRSEFLVDLDDFIVYKQPTKTERISALQELYTKENEQIVADNMNKCYVAMTRAIARLYIANDHDKSAFGKLFHETIQLHPNAVSNEDAWIVDLDEGNNALTYSEQQTHNFVPADLHERLWFPHIALQDRDELYEQDYLSDEMQYGLEFHQLIASTDRPEDIERVLDAAIAKGDVSYLHRAQLLLDLREIFNHPDYLLLLEGATKILSEQTIIGAKGVLLRPDKIIVKQQETILLDFKTGLPNPKNEKQIRQYKKVLSEIGFPDVRAFLFYTALKKMEQVG